MPRPLISLAALAALVTASTSWAQSDNDATSRSTVKAETRSAARAGQLVPAGERSPADTPTASTSSRTRAERKAETLAARRNHELVPPGGMGQQKYDAAVRAQRPTMTRADAKADTRMAISRGEMTPAGEGPGAPKK